MIAARCRRNIPLVVASAAFMVATLPSFSGTALATTVSASPDNVPNSGSVVVTLTGGTGMLTASAATLVNHDDSSVVSIASSLSAVDPMNPTQRQATFDLLNAPPGIYDITVSEQSGDETCVSSGGSPCFTIVGLPPTV